MVAVRGDIFWSAGLPPRIAESTKSDFYPGANELGHVLESVRLDLMKEAILSNNTPVDNSLTSTGNSSDKTSCELTIADLPTPSSSPPSPTPQQPSTSNRFNSDHSSGSPIDLLTKNNSDEQLIKLINN